MDSQKTLDQINDSLQIIRRLGVFDYQSQAASLNNAYADALTRGSEATANIIQGRINTLSKYGGIYIELSRMLESEIDRLSDLKAKYATYKINVEQTVPQIFIVDKAVKAERKALPKRSIIVIISTFSTFALALFFLLIIDQIKAHT
jgi:uncharacterized protein involved in exopolysaccharide biosynthesis